MYKGRPREDERSNEGKTKRNLMSVGGGSLKCKIIEAACKWLLVCVCASIRLSTVDTILSMLCCVALYIKYIHSNSLFSYAVTHTERERMRANAEKYFAYKTFWGSCSSIRFMCFSIKSSRNH